MIDYIWLAVAFEVWVLYAAVFILVGNEAGVCKRAISKMKVIFLLPVLLIVQQLLRAVIYISEEALYYIERIDVA